MIDLLETVRTAFHCFAEQEAHPFADASQEGVLCDVVHGMLAHNPNASVADLLENVRHWMIQDATQMTDDELRARIAFDAQDERRRAIAQANVDRARSSYEEARIGIRRIRAQLREDGVSDKERTRLKSRLRELKSTRDNNATPPLSSFEHEARRRGIAFHVEARGHDA